MERGEDGEVKTEKREERDRDGDRIEEMETG